MSPKPITENTLFYGENLEIMREYIPDESIDLIYLDPPFNSKRTYNVLFRDESGEDSEAQMAAFEDTWHWDHSTAAQYHELVTEGPAHVSEMIGALRQFIGPNQMMAYLVMMAARLVELQRVLKSTGSLYLHCDPTASHYLKIVLDTIFDIRSFRSEIIWKRYGAHSNITSAFGSVHDVILYYCKDSGPTFNKQYQPYNDDYIKRRFRFKDPDGRKWSEQNLANPAYRPNLIYEYTASNGITYTPPNNGWKITKDKMEQLDRENRLHFPKKEGGRLRLKNYLDELPGVLVQDVWNDISVIGGTSPERLGYPTQKPLTLLERIIKVSSNPGEMVLDPFCGCGTAIAAAQKLDRKWIGIDITHLAISLIKYRMTDMFPKIEFKVQGEPESLGAAEYLAEHNRFQFEWWALSLIKARPTGGQKGSKKGKKGADKGIDGVITFIDEAKGKPKRILIQVKSGHVKRGDIATLVGDVQRENAAMGVFLTLENPTKPMETEAATAGFYHSPGWAKDYPKIQILTIEQLLDGAVVDMPPTGMTFAQAPKVKDDGAGQKGLFG